MDKLTKPFGMRYSTSYEDKELEMQEQFCFRLFWLSKSDSGPVIKPGCAQTHRQSNLPQSLDRPWLLQSFYRTKLLQLQCLQLQCLQLQCLLCARGRVAIFSTLIVAMAGPRARATCVARSGTNHSAIQYDNALCMHVFISFTYALRTYKYNS
jgi:hypothetical protein